MRARVIKNLDIVAPADQDKRRAPMAAPINAAENEALRAENERLHARVHALEVEVERLKAENKRLVDQACKVENTMKTLLSSS